MTATKMIEEAFARRFGETPSGLAEASDNIVLAQLGARGSCRAFTTQVPGLALVETLCAAALCAPSKSDLQQRDILIVENPKKAKAMKELLGQQEWIVGAPRFVLFLANNRRQRQLQQLHDQPFPNDHLDAFFNASLDAGIALAFFMVAAESAGLGCCPISTIRNHLGAVARLFNLPDHVFPVAGLALGYPEGPQKISPRLPLHCTIQRDGFRETTPNEIRSYDARRSRITGDPAWSAAKARMYAEEQREDFATFAKSIGFKLG
ncbi:MAG: nitroreductase family protein [Pseudomonadota bacterium]